MFSTVIMKLLTIIMLMMHNSIFPFMLFTSIEKYYYQYRLDDLQGEVTYESMNLVVHKWLLLM